MTCQIEISGPSHATLVNLTKKIYEIDEMCESDIKIEFRMAKWHNFSFKG